MPRMKKADRNRYKCAVVDQLGKFICNKIAVYWGVNGASLCETHRPKRKKNVLVHD